jgi:organic radical activating enzyme
MMTHYPLSPNPIFWSIQGEGHLAGMQMAFVRLGGCSVGCKGCDTDYRVDSKATADEIATKVRAITPKDNRDRWVWITGGEPTDHDLRPLLKELKKSGFSTAVATSGVRRVIQPVDWLSVSPHAVHISQFQQRFGSELKIVDGLGGMSLECWAECWPDKDTDFMNRYVQPMSTGGIEDPSSMARCLEFIRTRSNWAISRQFHLIWGVP